MHLLRVALGLAACVCLSQSAAATGRDTLTAENSPGSVLTADDRLLGSVRDRLVARPLGDEAEEVAEEENVVEEEREALAAFYQEHGNKALWVTTHGLTERGRLVVREMQRAADWGLDPHAFDILPLALEPSLDDLVDAEVRISLAVLKYARHARGGRIENPAKQLSSYLDRKPQLREPRRVIEEIAVAAAPDAYLRSLNPQNPQFEKLRQKYLEIRDGHVMGDPSVKVPVKGPNLSPGKSHKHIALIRSRLGVTAIADETFYDDALANAVVAFQKARGLKPADGVIGKETREELNTGQTPSLKGLLANMEEWRWMPEDLGSLYVWVNIPDMTIRVVKNGTVVHSERVIVGTPETQTPIFSETMKTIVLRPKWAIPDSIKIKELLPSLARGRSLSARGYRARHNGRSVDPDTVDWGKVDIRKYQIYQPSGDDNALGIVKFLFPNKHSVYLHDTPSKHLFSSNQRAFSHGCIRVRQPMRLAELLLEADKGWNAGYLAGLVKKGPEDNSITLDAPIPVHVTYFTAWADENGELQYARDIYGHEERITLALAGKWQQIAKGEDHLAPIDPKRALANHFRVKSPERRSRTVSTRSRSRNAEAPDGVSYSSGYGGYSGYRGGGGPSRGRTTNDIFMESFGWGR